MQEPPQLAAADSLLSPTVDYHGHHVATQIQQLLFSLTRRIEPNPATRPWGPLKTQPLPPPHLNPTTASLLWPREPTLYPEVAPMSVPRVFSLREPREAHSLLPALVLKCRPFSTTPCKTASHTHMYMWLYVYITTIF